MKTEVLIIGAGPTGLALAAQLIRFGIDFIIIDENQSTTSYSKALGVQARTLEIYEQFGIADKLVSLGTVARSARLLEDGRVRGEVKLGEFGEGLSPYPFVLFAEQGAHESILYEYIKSNGHNVYWNSQFLGLSQNESGVTARVRSNDVEETIESKFLVGCDGPHSLVRHELGMSFEGGTFERKFYVADVEIDWEFPHESLHICLAKKTVTVFFPMAGGEKKYRIVGTFPEGHEKDEKEILYEEIEKEILVDTKLDLDITRVNWFSVYKVHSRAVNKFSSGRCFLAGDAAHIHTPVGAQGMNTGIQDGYDLAWRLAFVLKQNAGTEILKSYNDERLENAKQLLETTDRIFSLAASPNELFVFLRLHILPYIAHFAMSLKSVQHQFFLIISQIAINYRNSPISETHGNFALKAGDRMPYFLIDGTSIYDRLHAPKFHFLVFDDGTESMAELTNEFDPIADEFTIPLYPQIAEIFGTDRSFCVLLRPDNYIGYIASGVNVDGVNEYLKKVLSW